ncbi:MAG: YqaE/Pmp3 family membrane protein [Bacteroidota bacterium]
MKRLAILLPWFSFFLREKYTAGYICLALQISIVGWPVASLWATLSLLTPGAANKDNYVLRSLQPSFKKTEIAMQKIA